MAAWYFKCLDTPGPTRNQIRALLVSGAAVPAYPNRRGDVIQVYPYLVSRHPPSHAGFFSKVYGQEGGVFRTENPTCGCQFLTTPSSKILYSYHTDTSSPPPSELWSLAGWRSQYGSSPLQLLATDAYPHARKIGRALAIGSSHHRAWEKADSCER